MLLNVQELLSRRGSLQVRESLDLSARFEGSKDTAPLGPMAADLTVTSEDGMIEVTGELTGKLKLCCSRCLAPIEADYEIPYRESFKPLPKGEQQEESEDEDYVPVSGERFDLRPYLEEELLLYLPLAPLCQEDCKGLCPECGQNLNEQSCGCSRERIDPRFAALKDLFKDR